MTTLRQHFTLLKTRRKWPIYFVHVHQLSKKLITIRCSTHIVAYYTRMKINTGIFIIVVRALQGHTENKTNHTPSLLVFTTIKNTRMWHHLRITQHTYGESHLHTANGKVQNINNSKNPFQFSIMTWNTTNTASTVTPWQMRWHRRFESMGKTRKLHFFIIACHHVKEPLTRYKNRCRAEIIKVVR